MPRLDRPTRDTLIVLDALHTQLPLSTNIEMVLKQRAQQLATLDRQPRLQLRMLKPSGALAAKPTDDPLQPLPGTSEPIANSTPRPTRPPRTAQDSLHHPFQPQPTADFTGRRVKFAITGAEVGDHRWPPPSGRRWR